MASAKSKRIEATLRTPRRVQRTPASQQHTPNHEHEIPSFPSATAGILTAMATASATGMLKKERLILLTAAGYIEGDYIDENADLSNRPRETLMRSLAVFGNELYEGQPRKAPHSFIHLANVVIRAQMEVRVDNLIVFCDQVIAATIARTPDDVVR